VKKKIRKEVSGYAAIKPIELPSEVYAGMKSGKICSDDILKMVADMGGVLPS
jgi:hypothetical protein